MYFTPLTFRSGSRTNSNVWFPSVFFADLDEVHPHDCGITPHIAWETSPGSYQAVWFTDKFAYATGWAEYNRRVTYTFGADKGGWHGSKLLRVPGSVNWKRGGVKGQVLWADLHADPIPHYLWDEALVPTREVRAELEEAHPFIVEDKSTLDGLFKTLPHSAKFRLTQTNVNDRSKYIVATIHDMREMGVSKETAFQMLWYAPWNKWRMRNNPDRLWTEITNIYES